jgi:hypothetical protein
MLQKDQVGSALQGQDRAFPLIFSLITNDNGGGIGEGTHSNRIDKSDALKVKFAALNYL